MLLCLIFIILMIVGIVIAVLSCHCDMNGRCDTIGVIGVVVVAISLFSIMTCSLIALGHHTQKKEILEQYSSIIANYNTVQTDEEKIKVILKINEYNEEIKFDRENINNPWLNWFCDKDIAEYPSIELKAEDKEIFAFANN